VVRSWSRIRFLSGRQGEVRLGRHLIYAEDARVVTTLKNFRNGCHNSIAKCVFKVEIAPLFWERTAGMGIRIANDPPPPDDPLRLLVERGIVENHDVIRRRLAVSLRSFGTQISVEDIFQEMLTKAIERCATYRPGNSFIAWVLQIGMRLAIDQTRVTKKNPRSCGLDDVAELVAVNVLSNGDVVESSSYLHERLGRLRSDDRKILEARFIDQLSGEDLARAVGAPTASSARQRLHRAIVRLRDILDADSEGRS